MSNRDYVPDASWIGQHPDDYYDRQSEEEECEEELNYDEYIEHLIEQRREEEQYD